MMVVGGGVSIGGAALSACRRTLKSLSLLAGGHSPRRRHMDRYDGVFCETLSLFHNQARGYAMRSDEMLNSEAL